MTASAPEGRPALPSALAGPVRHRFLSPHYDDVPLSCGGTVALLARAGLDPGIVVLFGGEPDPSTPLSPFADALHARWGLAAGEVVAVRRREEAAAAAALGAASDFLPFPDAIYRGRRYGDNDRLFGEPVSEEDDLPARIAAALTGDTPPDPRVRLYAPLAVGGHVDHRNAFAVGFDLARAGWDVRFYEDLPYALRPGALDARLAALPFSSLEPAATIDVTPTWDAKLAAILAYPSQLPAVFRHADVGHTRAEIDAIMGTYARRIGDGTLAERLWRPAVGAVPRPSTGRERDRETPRAQGIDTWSHLC